MHTCGLGGNLTVIGISVEQPIRKKITLNPGYEAHLSSRNLIERTDKVSLQKKASEQVGVAASFRKYWVGPRPRFPPYYPLECEAPFIIEDVTGTRLTRISEWE